MKTLKKRRLKGKTDYKRRVGLLKSEKPRIVVRKTNKYIIGQYIESNEAKDKVIFGVTSKHLLKYGWPEELKGSLKNLTASYLTGYLLGSKIKGKEGILDIGLIRNIPKTRIFSFLKGAIDAGVKINASEKAFPETGKITGENLQNKVDLNKIKKSIEKNE